jgi:hypothetical protein
LFRFRAHGLAVIYDVEMRLNFSKTRQSFTISSDREATRWPILALDTGATWTLISWETAVLVGYDPASIQQRTAITTGSGISIALGDEKG